MLEHVEQLLGELGGEMEGEEVDPVLDEDYEPCSDDEEEEEEENNAEAPMEHWPAVPCLYSVISRLPIMLPSSLNVLVHSLKCLFLLITLSHPKMKFEYKWDAQKEWH